LISAPGCCWTLAKAPGWKIPLDTPAFLPAGVNDRDAARIAAEKGIECRPLSLYAQEEQAPSGLVLGFAAIPPQEIHAAAMILARTLEDFLKRNEAS
jgi:GntR family transcriptional regulator / MocR family aminotransferase